MVNSKSQKSPYTTYHKLYTIAKTLRAFTLIELLVVVSILGILSAVAADLFINITRSYNKANVIAEIGQNGNSALFAMTNEIRNALSVLGSTGSISIVGQDGVTVTFSFVPPCGGGGEPSCAGGGNKNGYVARNGLPATDDTWGTGVNVTVGQFTIIDADPPVVGITMTLAQPKGVPTRIDFRAETTLKTSVSLRSY